MSSVIGTRNLTLFPFPCSRTCDVSCTCRVTEISIPKPTMKCVTMNHRLFIHNEKIGKLLPIQPCMYWCLYTYIVDGFQVCRACA